MLVRGRAGEEEADPDKVISTMDYLSWADRSWLLLTRLMSGHAAIYRASHGLIGHRFPGAPPALLLDHVGAKSATRRTSPLVYGIDGENLVLVASKGWLSEEPRLVSQPHGQPRYDRAGRLAPARCARACR